jgi:hypothetical protein
VDHAGIFAKQMNSPLKRAWQCSGAVNSYLNLRLQFMALKILVTLAPATLAVTLVKLWQQSASTI